MQGRLLPKINESIFRVVPAMEFEVEKLIEQAKVVRNDYAKAAQMAVRGADERKRKPSLGKSRFIFRTYPRVAFHMKDLRQALGGPNETKQPGRKWE
ncbi:unnamed protein product [Toxocara canis]|uniref:30S ribosomal protein S21 n=1 Tax=Toxocara canis TaxID=6265 RepID=A0A183UR70_TOXCA|nr:unnamed protein product [Toxocara canis]